MQHLLSAIDGCNHVSHWVNLPIFLFSDTSHDMSAYICNFSMTVCDLLEGVLWPCCSIPWRAIGFTMSKHQHNDIENSRNIVFLRNVKTTVFMKNDLKHPFGLKEGSKFDLARSASAGGRVWKLIENLCPSRKQQSLLALNFQSKLTYTLHESEGKERSENFQGHHSSSSKDQSNSKAKWGYVSLLSHKSLRIILLYAWSLQNVFGQALVHQRERLRQFRHYFPKCKVR